jgi:hypothetical protein
VRGSHSGSACDVEHRVDRNGVDVALRRVGCEHLRVDDDQLAHRKWGGRR